MFNSNFKGLCLDIHGVLFNSSSNGTCDLIKGSIESIKKLKKNHFPFILVTNESQLKPVVLHQKLQSLGFDVESNDIYSPIMAISDIIKSDGLKPFCIKHDNLGDFIPHYDIGHCDSVIVTDATHQFTFDNMNKAFNFLFQNPQCRFISAGKGKYYKDALFGLMLDLGAFTEALEFSTGRKAEIVGKPSLDFFSGALKKLGLGPNEVAMVGDDILNDVGGAQSCGMYGVLVRSGKYRVEDENHPSVKPNMVVNCLEDFVDKLLC